MCNPVHLQEELRAANEKAAEAEVRAQEAELRAKELKVSVGVREREKEGE